MYPDEQPTNQPPGSPLFHDPYHSPVEPGVSQPVAPLPIAPEEETEDSKLPLIIGLVAGLELLIIIGLAVVLLINGSKNSPTPTNSGQNQNQSELGAATPLSLQQTDDSISQDLSGLHDDQDLAPNKLSDQALGL